MDSATGYQLEQLTSTSGPVVLSASAQGKRFGTIELESLDTAVRAGTIEIPVELQGQVSVALERWILTAQHPIRLNAHLEISQNGRCCWRDEVYADNPLLLNAPAGESQVRAFKFGTRAIPGNPKYTFDQTKMVNTQPGVVIEVVFSGEQ